MKYLYFDAGSTSALSIPASRLLSMDNNALNEITLSFEDMDAVAGATTDVTLTVNEGKVKKVMETITESVHGGRDNFLVIADSVNRIFVDSDITAVSVDDSGTGSNGLTAGAAITESANTVYHSWIERNGDIIKTSIYIDLTDLEGTATANDIIGIGTDPAHLGQVTTARCGTIFDVVVKCTEAPDADLQELDLIASADADGQKGDAYGSGGDFTDEGTVIVDADYSAVGITGSSALPAADDYLYLASVTETADTATSGKLLIELYGKA